MRFRILPIASRSQMRRNRTPDYVDDVLHFKIKNLVYVKDINTFTLPLIHDPRSGAIKRSALEKTEPTINYESFVNELDTGDSFTTSLIDILVKVCVR